MTTTWRPRSMVGHQSHTPSPLRHASTASSGSSGPPSRSSTISSRGSSTYNYNLPDRTRTSIEPANGKIAELDETPRTTSATETYQSMRRSLRPAVNSITSSSSAETIKPLVSHSRSQSVEPASSQGYDHVLGTSSPPTKRPMSMALSRSDSVSNGSKHQVHFEAPSLEQFQKSSTSHLRALSKFAKESEGDDQVQGARSSRIARPAETTAQRFYSRKEITIWVGWYCMDGPATAISCSI